MTFVVALGEAKQPWFWGITDAIVLVLLLANVLLLVIVHVRRARQFFRRRRENRCRDLVERLLSEIAAPTPAHDALWVRREIGGLDGLERPIAARMLIDRLSAASEQERAHMLAVLREVGGLEMILRSTRRRMPWRRALAVRTLGWTGAPEAVPVLLEAVSDRNRYVRSSAVRALGRIGDARALPLLGELFRTPGRVEPGVSYDALLAFGTAAAPVFAGGLRSDAESVRVASCFGVAALSEPEDGRRLLEPLLADERAPVRMAAAESLGHVGGALLPDALARATRDEQRGARNAAVGALGSFDDPRAVELASNALLDPDRDTAVRAGESLVRLSRLPAAGRDAVEALRQSETEWPVERALVVASLGAL